MSDENNESDFEFTSSENLENPSKEYVLNKVLDSYLTLLEDVDDIENNINKNSDKIDKNFSDLKENTENNHARINESYEELKEKILKLVEMIKERPTKNHTHDEFDEFLDIKKDLESEINELSDTDENLESSLESVMTSIEEIESDIKLIKDEKDELYNKMTRLAHSHLSLKKEFNSFKQVQSLKNEAMEKSVTEAICEDCDEEITIMSLDKRKCPHCDIAFSEIEKRMLFSHILKTVNYLPSNPS